MSTAAAPENGTPSWINKELLLTALKNGGGHPELEVQEFDVQQGTNIGDNYMSIVYRVTVKTRSKSGSKTYKLVMKCLPEGEFRRQMLSENNIFRREIEVYEMAVPAFRDLQKKKGVTPLFSGIPNYFYSVLNGENDMLIMEDLSPQGFKMAERRNGLDYNHCRITLQQLAKFHSYSLVLKQEDLKGFLEKFGFFEELMYVEKNMEKFSPFFAAAIDAVKSVVTTIPGYERFVSRLEELKLNFFDKCAELCRSVEPLSVLCHGDFWINNMLFSYTKKGDILVPNDVRFFDFQVARYASPALDLQYFFYTSTTQQLRNAHYQDLLHVYHDSLSNSLEQLGSDPSVFTFQMLEQEMKDKLMFGFVSACSVLCAVLAEPEDVPDMDSMTEEEFTNCKESPFAQMYRSKAYRSRISEILLDVEKQGMFEDGENSC